MSYPSRTDYSSKVDRNKEGYPSQRTNTLREGTEELKNLRNITVGHKLRNWFHTRHRQIIIRHRQKIIHLSKVTYGMVDRNKEFPQNELIPLSLSKTERAGTR